jgi:hypothetical protein
MAFSAATKTPQKITVYSAVMCGSPKILCYFHRPTHNCEYMISFGGFYLLSVENLVPLKNIEICTACVMPLPTLSLSHLGQSSCCPPRRAAIGDWRKMVPRIFGSQKNTTKNNGIFGSRKNTTKNMFYFRQPKKTVENNSIFGGA